MKYRTVNFRDDVLWAIARKAGLNPVTDLSGANGEQADAYASSINAWVRKLWDSIDWPEWTDTSPRTPVTRIGDNNFIPYEPDPLGPDKDEEPLGRVLKVYLANPEVTPGPIDTPFRLSDKGVFVGFDHGSTVWIKHVARAPQFTAKKWNINNRYGKDELTYSPVTGECYKSLLDGNLAIDPATEGVLSMGSPTLLQAFQPKIPGIPEISEIWTVKIKQPTWYNLITTKYTITITDEDGDIHGVTYTTPADGGTLAAALAAIAAVFAASPDPFITGLTVTTNTPTGGIQIELATAGFSVKATVQNAGESPDPLDLRPNHAQMHVAAILAVNSAPQKTELFFSDNLEGIPAIYKLVITDNAGVTHTATAEVASELSIPEIMIEIIKSISLAADDTFFGGLVVIPDLANGKLTFVINQDVQIQITATSNVPLAWELRPFPFALCDAVVSGALSDAMREEGQTDKAQAEEQGSVTENTGRVAAGSGTDYDVLTDQERVRSRYRVA